jgi:chemotaxis protein MotB
MAAGRRSRHDHEAEHDDSERWLLTYADMITLLMALFMVLFAMSSVDEKKFDSVAAALSTAFDGKVFDGGQSIQQTGGDQTSSSPSAAQLTAIVPMGGNSAQARNEQEDFRRLKAMIDRAAKAAGVDDAVETTIEKRGLAVRVLSDNLLFASGSADLNAAAKPLLATVGRILSTDKLHPVRVEGHTDNLPITGRYPSNWELSGARASAVVRALMSSKLSDDRFEAVGLAQREPAGSNATAAGRAKNRRVEIVLPRRHGVPAPATPREEIAQIRPDLSPPSTATEGTR